MPTIKDELYLNFDGVNSRDFGLIAVELGTGLYEETLVANRTINETKPNERLQSIFHGITEENRAFELNLAFEDSFNEDKINDVINWLFQDYYKPLYFEGQEDRIVFAIISGETNIIHNGLEQGYFTVTVQTNSPYRFSRMRTGNRVGDTMTLVNNGHETVYPEFSIKKIGKGDLRIEVDGRNVLIINLTDGEELYIDTLKDKIVTDIRGEYRYDNVTIGELSDLYLEVGEKEYTITGGADITYRYREAYKF